ncbi:MAG: RluA family pseudouridine synthase [Deltaproteobacteria bacterium]|nr:RluA family pseudouridine synthase [Deltaproteobacteria bacterium]
MGDNRAPGKKGTCGDPGRPLGYFGKLEGNTEPETLFDDPVPNPPPVGPPYSGGPPTLAGDLDPKMEGRPLWELCGRATGLPEAKARELVDFGCLWLGKFPITDPEFRLPKDGTFRVNLPEYGPVAFYEPDPSRIVFEDEDILVYDKESGRPSQAVPYDNRNNVHSGFTRLRGMTLRLPHRLDLGTSGLLIMSKNQRAAGFLGKLFQNGLVRKRYLALSGGDPPDWEETDATASVAKAQQRYVVRDKGPGKSARTHLKVLSARDGKVLFLAVPHTGRTHQIRLHLSHLGYPILGDAFYGGAPHRRLMLRASGIAFRHPTTHEPMVLGGPWEEGEGSGDV